MIIPNRSWLVWEWLLNWNAYDTNDWTKNNWTATNVTYVDTDIGYQKQSGSFNGSSSKVTWLNMIDTKVDFSLSAQVKISSLTWNKMIFRRAWGTVPYTYLVVNATTWTLTFFLNPGSCTTTAALTVWKDYHIAITRAWNIGSIYINWILSAQWTWTQSWVNIWNNSELWNNENLNWFNWQIQWVRIFNRALSQKEIQIWYQEWLRELWDEHYSLLNWLVAYYDFNWDANDIVWGNNGTVSGSTLTNNRFWIVNSAYNFNGINNGIVYFWDLWLTWNKTIINIIKVNSEITTWTWALWEHYTTTGSIDSSLLYDYNSGNRRLIFRRTRILIIDNDINYNISLWSTDYYILAYTYDGTNVIWYINWKSIWSVASSGNWTWSYTNHLSIWNNKNINRFANITTDTVLCFNRALSASEIKTITDILKQKNLYPY